MTICARDCVHLLHLQDHFCALLAGELMCEWIVSWQSVKECLWSISIQNCGSDVRFDERCHVFLWDRFV